MQKVVTPRLIVTIVITVACLLLTFPTFRYFALVAGMESNPTAAEAAARDEMLKHKQMVKLGLDLQGGADFLLAVDSERLQRATMENYSETLRRAFADPANPVDADVKLYLEDTPPDPRITVKLNEKKDLNFAVETLDKTLNKTVYLQAAGSIRDGLEAGELVLRPEPKAFTDAARQSMEGAYRVIKRRVDEFGLTNPIVTMQGQDRIRVQIPGENDPARIRSGLLKTASLEFRLLHPDHNNVIKPFIEGGMMLPGAGTGRAAKSIIEEVESTESGKVVKKKRLKSAIPGIPAGYVLRLGVKTEIDPTTNLVIPSKTIDDLVYMVTASAPLTGKELSRATAYTDPSDLKDPIKVSIQFKAEGTKIFAAITEQHTGERFGIILDDVVYSAPNINEPIRQGTASISGGFSQAEAHDLSLTLRAGALEAPLKILEENTIGPSLGVGSVKNSLVALGIGAVFIIALMTIIYTQCGFIAIIAMFLNLLLVLAGLSLMGATLTLSGIGGMLLTMGMAVDANILIYERLREELESGKPMRAAINIAFDRAFTVIFDSHITALLPALVLVLFEVVDGSVKGFWVSLVIGIIANLYTGVWVTRALVESWYAYNKTVSAGKIHLFKNINIHWMRHRTIGMVLSIGITVVSIGFLAVKGFNFGIDFSGGVLTTVEIKGTTNEDQDRMVKALEEVYSEVRVVKVINSDIWQVTVPSIKDQKTGQRTNPEEIKKVVAEKLVAAVPKAEIKSSQSVDPIMGEEFVWVAVSTVAVAGLIIMGYLALRFQFIFGTAAVLAMLHDVFLSIGVFRLMGHSITLDIVSGVLIVLGYSVNDTIVVFDRIREKMQDRTTLSINDLMDAAINETLSRTILTVTTTFIAIVCMYFFGGVGLSDFALILMLGVLFGTYSSVFIASALVCIYYERHTGEVHILGHKKAVARVQVPKVTNTSGN